MMLEIKESLIGQVFNNLTIISDLGTYGKNFHRKVKVRCNCGNEKIMRFDGLRNGHAKSCGCQVGTHNLSHSDIYNVWAGIKKRCYNKNGRRYKDYGARGITMCAQWKDNFLSFHEWANQNGYKKGLYIDRINNDKGYSPENCRFVNPTISNRNRRINVFLDYNGQNKTIAEWSELTGIKYAKISTRIKRYNWTIERALTTP